MQILVPFLIFNPLFLLSYSSEFDSFNGNDNEKETLMDVAKELNLASADILFHANEIGIEVKTASSGLTEDEVELLKLKFDSESNIKEAEEVSEPDNTSPPKNKKNAELKIKEITQLFEKVR